MQLFGTRAESAEQVAPVDLGRRILATEGRFDSRSRRLQPEGPVWAMGVVVLDVDPQQGSVGGLEFGRGVWRRSTASW